MASVRNMMLWFDVEERYNTTYKHNIITTFTLWFDVEERYNTTAAAKAWQKRRCGLM